VFAVLQGSANPHSRSPELVAGQRVQVTPAQGLPAPVGATYVILNRGDVVLVHGSNLLCRFRTDELKLVCILTNNSGPLPHSWGTSMNIDGAVEVFRFDADGTSTTTKKFPKLLRGRPPTASTVAARPGKVYRLKVGDRFRVSSTRIACRLKRGNSSLGRSPVAHCYYIVKSKETTREFVINNFFAGVFSVQLTLNPAGTILDVKRLKTPYAKKQPRLG
jgi:hypothetical protein